MVMHFEVTVKLTTDCVSLYNNAGLISKISEKITSENAENAVVDNPLSFDAPSPGNIRDYPHKPYIARNWTGVIGLHFCG